MPRQICGRGLRWQRIWQIAGLLTLIGGSSLGLLLVLPLVLPHPARAASDPVSLVHLAASVIAAVLVIGGYTLVHLDRDQALGRLACVWCSRDEGAPATKPALLVPPSGLLGAWTYEKQGQVDLRIALRVAAGFFSACAQHGPPGLAAAGAQPQATTKHEAR